MSKLYVRFSTQADADKVLDFYKENRHEHVAVRDQDVLRERTKSGGVTLIEDEAGKIVAAGVSYPVMKQDNDGQEKHVWTEIGSVRITIGGIGLFDVLVSAQMLRAFLLEPPDDRFIVEIERDNKHSQHVFKKLGAQEFAKDKIPDGMMEAVSKTIDPADFDMDVFWYHYGAEGMPHLARLFEKKVADKTLTNPKTGEVYELDFSKCLLQTAFSDVVADLAKADLGDRAQPDLKKGLKDTSLKFTP